MGGAVGKIGFIIDNFLESECLHPNKTRLKPSFPNFAKTLIAILTLSIVSLSAQTYKTYYPWESDSVLVAWTIDRFVDKNATFMTVDKKKEKIAKKNSINSSNSDLRRTARFTAFEMALHHYKIKSNGCIDELKRVIRVLEMTPWKKHEYLKALKFEEDFVPTFPSKIGEDGLDKAFETIDNFCKDSKK